MRVIVFFMAILCACTPFQVLARQAAPDTYDNLPLPTSEWTEMTYTPRATHFQLWAPTADRVELKIYDSGSGGTCLRRIDLKAAPDGMWHTNLEGNWDGKFYTFNVYKDERWLGENPGVNAKAVGINGERGAIIDLRTTDPEGWDADRAPKTTDVVIYEMHHRDFSVHPASGIKNKGKFLALTETGTKTPDGQSTGIDHLRELGVTHVHILPSYDYGSVDEQKLDEPQYNWGYDPVNYNVPEGSYSTNPADPKARIREFKKMVKALHDNGMKVVLDVVYNHTYDLERSNFERTVPGYFYRHLADGSAANASGCGNETASERAMMRRYMIESVEYWMREYHIDGFRFDLMGIHDVETMNQIRAAAARINPEVLIYGEGWAAAPPQLLAGRAAMKAEVHHMPGIAAFSDELRDALRGPFSDDTRPAFLAGLSGHEESIKFGIAGGIAHPQVRFSNVNYTQAPWAEQPHQLISYVSCHDDMCLTDRLRASIPGISEAEVSRLALVAQTAVFTSQGVPFMLSGEELGRTKQMVHNSYNSPDSINQIDWAAKTLHSSDFEAFRTLIRLRREHPAFRLGSAELVRKHLDFLPAPDGVVAYWLKDNAGGDRWSNIVVVLNGTPADQALTLPPFSYHAAFFSRHDMAGYADPNRVFDSMLLIPPQSALILYTE